LCDDGATARNSLENCFPEYLAVTFSRCIGYQKGQQIFVPSGYFLILERAKNRRGLSQVNKVDSQFFVMEFLARKLLTYHAHVHCHGRESTYQPRVRVFSSKQIPVTLSALANNTADLPFVLVQ